MHYPLCYGEMFTLLGLEPSLRLLNSAVLPDGDPRTHSRLRAMVAGTGIAPAIFRL